MRYRRVFIGVLEQQRDFDKEAADWDQSADRRAVAETVAACIAQHVELGHEIHMIDCGCGTGLVTLPLAKRVGSVVAMDASAQMIAALTAKLERSKVANVIPIQGKIEGLARRANRYDVVLCTQTLLHVGNVGEALAAFSSLLQPGGALVISEMEIAGDLQGSLELEREALARVLEGLALTVEGVFDAAEFWVRRPDGVSFQKRYYVLVATKR